MKVLITKTDNDYYYDIKNFKTIKDLINFMKKSKHPLILQENEFNNEYILDFWDGMTSEDKKIVQKLEYNIEIYNSWRE